MITSMTGFGRGEASAGGISVTVELKTVNSRYLDISLRVPSVIQDKELDFKELLQKHLERGKVNINVRIDKTETGVPDVIFNENMAKGYKNMLDKLCKKTGINERVRLQDL